MLLFARQPVQLLADQHKCYFIITPIIGPDHNLREHHSRCNATYTSPCVSAVAGHNSLFWVSETPYHLCNIADSSSYKRKYSKTVYMALRTASFPIVPRKREWLGQHRYYNRYQA